MAKPYTVLAEMQSNSTGEKYEIRRGADQNVYCSCLGWRFSKLRPRTCRHLALYSEDTLLRPNQQIDRGPVTVVTSTPAPSAVAAALAAVAVRVPVEQQTPTALDHALGLTRKMVAAARLTLAPVVVQMMAAELAKHIPAPGPALAAPIVPGRVRMITFD